MNKNNNFVELRQNATLGNLRISDRIHTVASVCSIGHLSSHIGFMRQGCKLHSLVFMSSALSEVLIYSWVDSKLACCLCLRHSTSHRLSALQTTTLYIITSQKGVLVICERAEFSLQTKKQWGFIYKVHFQSSHVA